MKLVDKFFEDIIFTDCQVEYAKPHKPDDFAHPISHEPDYTKDYVLYYGKHGSRKMKESNVNNVQVDGNIYPVLTDLVDPEKGKHMFSDETADFYEDDVVPYYETVAKQLKKDIDFMQKVFAKCMKEESSGWGNNTTGYFESAVAAAINLHYPHARAYTVGFYTDKDGSEHNSYTKHFSDYIRGIVNFLGDIEKQVAYRNPYLDD